MIIAIGPMVLIALVLIVAVAVIAIVAANSKKETADVSEEGSYFDGNTWQLIGYRILSALVSAITLGIAYPWMLCMMQRWETKHTVINGRRLKFNGKGIQLIGKYLLWVLLTIITFGIYGIWLGLGIKKWVVKHTVYADEEHPVDSYFSGGAGGYLGIHILWFALTLFTLGIGKAWADRMVLQWEAKHTHIGGSPLNFNGTGGQLFAKYLLLILLTPLTLGIYAIFFTVIYMKWQVKHTEAVYQTSEIQAKARAHEMTAVQDFAKYRIAANDQEIAAMKSGYTGKEDAAVLEQLAAENNPFAAYHLAKQLKGENALYEDRALELLQKAADGKIYCALLDLAKQLPAEQMLSMLTEAAQCGSAEASWLLVEEHQKNANLTQAAYWFKIALEWGLADAKACEAEYDELVRNIALQLSENRAMPKSSKALPIALGAAGGLLLLLLAAGAMAVLGFTPRLASKDTPEHTLQIEDVEIVQTANGEYVEGERFAATGMEEREYEYILNETVFYDRDEQMLYFLLSKEQGEYGLFLCVGDSWRTEAVGTSTGDNGILRVRYPYEITPTFEISVREDNGLAYGGLLNFHTLNVTQGTTSEAETWVEEKISYYEQEDEPTEDNTELTDPSDTVFVEPQTSIADSIVGQWEMCDMVTDMNTGDEILHIWRWTFNADGTVVQIAYRCHVDVNGTEYYYGKAWARIGGDRGDGTYTINGDELTITTRDVNGDTYYTSVYAVELSEGILSVTNSEELPKRFERTNE